jgi:outer membrane protein assembly factor BamB
MVSEKNPKPLRVLPGIVLVIILWVFRYGLPVVFPSALVVAVLGSIAICLLILIWWLAFSRVPPLERWVGAALLLVAMISTRQFVDVSLQTSGQGMLYYIYALPVLCLALVVWAAIRKYLSVGMHRPSLVVVLLLASGFWTLLRIDGITGDFNIDLEWRWAPTDEERLLSSQGEEYNKDVSMPLPVNQAVVWPGFRGSERNSVIPDVRVSTDWKKNPPETLWKKAVGPGCSSFAIWGDLFYTQEQRGEVELVTCYHLQTGELLWKHADSVRFWDSHAGAGPRATPTIYGSTVFTVGATGLLNALDASNGKRLWSRDILKDADVDHSGWGCSASPVVVNDRVIVAAVGRLVGYEMDTGDLAWIGENRGDSYSSPQLVTIDSVQQVLLQSGAGLISVHPFDGSVLWEYAWPGESRIVQPALFSENGFYVPDGTGMRLKRVRIERSTEPWTFTELWTSNRIQPNFNDFVVHKGHIYGYRGMQLVCVDGENGERTWAGDRFGGQILLLEEQDLLLILTEEGDVVLVKAIPDAYEKVAKMSALFGRTWNHPAMTGDVLLVRNSQEMAAFRLPGEI